jgi:hypothetical protein
MTVKKGKEKRTSFVLVGFVFCLAVILKFFLHFQIPGRKFSSLFEGIVEDCDQVLRI